jgi:hypothetical protein
MRKKRSKARRINPIYVSPDGGETVYEQLPSGERRLIEKSQKAIDEEQAMDDMELVDVNAIKLRRKYPSLKKAWDQYRTVWHLIVEKL